MTSRRFGTLVGALWSLGYASSAVAADPAHAPEGQRSRTFLWFEMSLPALGTYDYAGNFSGRGGALEHRLWLAPRFSLGLRGAWHVLTARQQATETRGVVTITGTRLHTINLVPLEATAHYYFGHAGTELAPYVGAGVGAAWAERSNAFPGWSSATDGWHVALTPEVGLLLPMDWAQAALGLRFNYLAPSGAKPEETYFSFSLGLTER